MKTAIVDERVATFYAELGARIKTHREWADLTQAELARRIGFSRPSIANIECGRQRVDAHVLVRIADVLNTDPRALLPTAGRA